MKLKWCKVILLALSVSVASADDYDTVVDLHHWWKAPSELDALKVIEASVIKRGGKFESYVLDNFEKHRVSVIERVNFGYLPAVTHWLAGSELLALSEEGLLIDLPSTIGKQKIKDVLYNEVISEIETNGQLSALPVGLHIQNTAFFSSNIYQKLELTPPTTWQEFFEQAPKIQEAGFTPLAVSDNLWQLSAIMDAYMISTGGEKALEGIYGEQGDLKQWRPLLIELFELLMQLKPLSNPDYASYSWDKNTEMVAQGKAAMQIIGDFAEAVMVYNNYQAGQDYTYAMAPGNDNIMIYGVDVFALLKVADEARKQGQSLMVETVLDPAVQRDYVLKKGGLSVRRDVDVSDYSESRSKVYRKWIDAKVQKVKMPRGHSTFRTKLLVSLALNIWQNPQQADARKAADTFISMVLDNQ